MADKSTFIKLDRNIATWRWFKNSKILHVFLWLLIKANIKEGHFERETISRGSLATSNASIADGCGLTIQNVRTALGDLENTGEITRIQKNHYQIITVVNYELYQSDSRKLIGQLTGNHDSNSQATVMATNRQLTTIKEYNNINNGKNERIYTAPLPPHPYPCGTYQKPEWMDDDLWKVVKFRTIEDIPCICQGFYDSYIEFAEEMHTQGTDVK